MDPFASALEQAAAVRRREVSARELVDMYLERIARDGGRTNAFWLTTPELAWSQADEELPDGPLAGACTSVKELAPMAGFPINYGSRAFQRQIAERDHFVVTKIKAAGCPILGRTTTPELGSRPVTEFGLHGATRNPWSLDHTSGGSSGGAAAALAAGLCAWSHGTDGGGSVRIPASCCGVVGLKPSRGRISMGPVIGEGWAGLSTPGVITRTVQDAGAALDALAGHLPGDPYWAESRGSFLEAARQAPDRLRIGVQVDAESEVHPELVDLVREVAGRLDSLGHQVEEAGPDTRPFRSAQETIVAAGTASYDIEDLSVLDPLNAWLLEQSRRLTAADYVRAVNTVRTQSRLVVAFWDDHDVLLTPTLTQPPFELGHFGGDPERAVAEGFDWLCFTYPYNCTGQPAISLPLGHSFRGLPLGVQLVGPPRGEALLLALAEQLEKDRPWAHRLPPDSLA
jgi:amidase